MHRIGVFVCWCGSNIAGTVDVHKVAETLKNEPGVVYSTDYQYMCSEAGQNMVKDAIKEYNLPGLSFEDESKRTSYARKHIPQGCCFGWS